MYFGCIGKKTVLSAADDAAAGPCWMVVELQDEKRSRLQFLRL